MWSGSETFIDYKYENIKSSYALIVLIGSYVSPHKRAFLLVMTNLHYLSEKSK